ncbi:hypothetical protein PMAYCL1PPCAC_06841, partial [Pristionchus mayeri]
NHLLCRPTFLKMHFKCRNSEVPYLNSQVKRTPVPDDKAPWGIEWTSYAPVEYTDPDTIGKPWSDTNDLAHMRFNALDGKVNRKSHLGDYSFDVQGRPLNPIGRTGMSGKGILGRWGPNHAADPIVSRIKNGRLQFVAIKRKDTGEWAIPGGMVDPGERVSATLKREFAEEALGGKNVCWIGCNSTCTDGPSPIYSDAIFMIYRFRMLRGTLIQILTVVVNFHDYDTVMEDVTLEAGDDAQSVRWVFVDSNEPLYASHKLFIDLLKKFHNA